MLRECFENFGFKTNQKYSTDNSYHLFHMFLVVFDYLLIWIIS